LTCLSEETLQRQGLLGTPRTCESFLLLWCLRIWSTGRCGLDFSQWKEWILKQKTFVLRHNHTYRTFCWPFTTTVRNLIWS